MKKIVLFILLFPTLLTYAQQWITYRDTNSGLPFNWVNKIEIDNYDNKWLLDGNANLVKFDNTNWTVYNYTNSGFPAQGGKAITIDKNDNKWIATSVGLVKYDANSWVKYDSSNSCLPTNNILDCDVDTLGNIWLATDLGIVMFDTSHNCTLYTTSNGNALGGIPEIRIDSRNWVWTLSNSFTGPFDISVFDGILWKNYSSFSIGPNVGPSHLFCDSIGNIWGSAGDGILKSNGSGFSVSYDTSISGHFFTIGSVYANSSFIAASSLQKHSLNYYSNSSWSYYDKFNSPLNFLLFDFACDKYGNLWIAGEYGVYEFNPNGIVGINELNAQMKNIDIYPSPFYNKITLQPFNASAEQIVINILNDVGELVYTKQSTLQLQEIDLSALAGGVYLLQVQGKEESFMKRVVKL